MRQIVQHMGTDLAEMLEAPVPSTQTRSLLIQTIYCLVLAGTERMSKLFQQTKQCEKNQ
jgi:hypothetical protein